MIEQIDIALTNILKRELADTLKKPGQIGVYSPHDRGETVLGLYLYSIRNCAEVNSPVIAAAGRNIKVMPPRFVTLYYLLTVYGTAELPFRALEEHRILTRAIEAFEKNSVLNESTLGFKPGTWIDELKLQFVDLDVGEIAQIWGSRDASYPISVAYKVSPVELSVLIGHISSRISEAGSDFSSMDTNRGRT